jgi:CRP-like cAMP-binding protein
MVGKMKLRSWLNSHYRFLTDEDLDLFSPYLIERTFEKEEYVLTPGSCCREMSFVTSGVYRMFYLAEGKEINVHFFFDDHFMVDYGSFLHQTPSRFFIQAIERSEAVSFDHEVLWRAYDQSKNWERFGRLMAELCSAMVTDRLEMFLFMDGKERYLQLMRDNPGIFDKLPLYHLASYLGMERESLSRIRQRISRS